MKTIAWLLLFCLPAFADAPPTVPSTVPPTVPIDELVDPLPWLIAKVESAKDPHWYGTAILFGTTRADYLFLTNRHVLPADLKRADELRLRSPLHRYEADTLHVIATAPGHDLAVISIARGDQQLAGLEKLLAQAFVTDDIGGKKLRQGILGFPGMQEFASELRPGLKTDPWFPWFFQGDFKDVANHFNLSPAMAVTKLEVCPPPFLKYCYRSPISSLGFSGGAYETAPEISTDPATHQVAGIVSHFSPLTSQTFVIPMALALPLARKMVDEGDQLLSDDGKFRYYLPDGTIEILSTKQKLRKAAPGATSPGGHDGAGGGGESGPGGHDGAGGGGGIGGDAPVIASPLGNMAMIGEFPKLQASLNQPAKWNLAADPLRRTLAWMPAFKGITALLDYRPGVFIDDKITQKFGDETVVNLSDFLRQYARYPERVPRADFDRRDWPRGLGILADRDMGRRAYGEIRRFRAPKELSKIDSDWKNDSSFVLRTLAPLTGVHSKTPGADLIVTYSSAENHSPIRVAQLSRINGRVHIMMMDWVWGMIDVDFPDALVQYGDRYYRWEGELTASLPRRPWTESGYRGVAHGTIVLQQEPAEGLWEMKILLGYQPPVANDPGKTVLTPESIRMEGFYLPMVDVAQYPATK